LFTFVTHSNLLHLLRIKSHFDSFINGIYSIKNSDPFFFMEQWPWNILNLLIATFVFKQFLFSSDPWRPLNSNMDIEGNVYNWMKWNGFFSDFWFHKERFQSTVISFKWTISWELSRLLNFVLTFELESESRENPNAFS
jgi:hypothetical protein